MAVIEATRRIGRLAEIIDGVAAAAELEHRAKEAAVEVAEVGKLTVREGNPGDDAINDWIAAMMSLYRSITGKEPATSIGSPDRPDEGIAAGPRYSFSPSSQQAAERGIGRRRLPQPRPHDPEGRQPKLRTIWPF